MPAAVRIDKKDERIDYDSSDRYCRVDSQVEADINGVASVDRVDPDADPQSREKLPHGSRGLGIKGREDIVKEQQRGFRVERPGKRNTSLLTT
ncbi:hypothetical protein VP1G_10849 [Cytospora mali]|uniref:Uncharacterized protein n=1 Tax=Cytospora mali TaxID=578113 RepID=A0A194UYW0_CYTMA|nr:hypothetical protein VP1G_10849 [Valsa mali var. pyri (nom. inval.)]